MSDSVTGPGDTVVSRNTASLLSGKELWWSESIICSGRKDFPEEAFLSCYLKSVPAGAASAVEPPGTLRTCQKAGEAGARRVHACPSDGA